jgi:hypothetical protein
VKKILLIKRRRKIVIEIEQLSLKKRTDRPKTYKTKITSIVMISRRIDEFEDEIREKMFSEMRIFSCKTHSQSFLRSLVPSLRKEDEKKS